MYVRLDENWPAMDQDVEVAPFYFRAAPGNGQCHDVAVARIRPGEEIHKQQREIGAIGR